MQFLVESNPAFLIIKTNDDQFVFYNSLQHRASRLNYLEMMILDMYYTYQSKNYILSLFDNDKKKMMSEALTAIDNHKLLLCEDLHDTDSKKPVFPSSYYLHLTYQCNLKCTYCYNKNIRKGNKSVLALSEWKIIIDKIAPYARIITLTGGEFFLYPDLIGLLEYINQKCPTVVISAISNGMHDFEKKNLAKAFEYISSISFSCDSISNEGERKGFDPVLYQKNILWVKKNFPNIKVTVASTVTSSNSQDIKETSSFCQNNQCEFSKAILIPENATEVDMMPSIEEQINLSQTNTSGKTINRLKPAAFRCGAGKSVCSIDPSGNIYPCQSLHYSELCMGNILHDRIEDLSYFGKEGYILKTVNDFAMCSKCKVKYICGGGCPATAYKFYGNKIGPNHLTCRINYVNSIDKLKLLNRVH